MTYPTDQDIDAAFPDNSNGDITAEVLRTFEKTMTAAGRDWASIENAPASYPPAAHNHPISEVTDLQVALDGKAPSVHTHSTAQVTGLDGEQQAQDDAINDLAAQLAGHTLAVVASLPGTPDENTIYFVTG